MQALYRLTEPCSALHDLRQLRFQQLGVEKLLAVLPLVNCFRLVEAFIALQSNQGSPGKFGTTFGKFGLTHAWGALYQDRFFECGG